jgi:hypothetical protein
LKLRIMESKNISKRRKNTLIFSSLMTAAVLGMLPIGSLNFAGNSSSGSLGSLVAEAQNFGQRTIQGKVIGDGDTPVNGATVFLKNLKTRDVKSFTSTPDGSFRFAQVGMVDDYEVWAEQGKRKSAVKTVSSFDARKMVEFDLKLK